MDTKKDIQAAINEIGSVIRTYNLSRYDFEIISNFILDVFKKLELR